MIPECARRDHAQVTAISHLLFDGELPEKVSDRVSALDVATIVHRTVAVLDDAGLLVDHGGPA